MLLQESGIVIGRLDKDRFVMKGLLFLFPLAAQAAFFDKSGSKIADANYDHPDMYWPLVSIADSRFWGVASIRNTALDRACSAVLLKTWNGPFANASAEVKAAKGLAITSGTCFNNPETAEKSRILIDRPLPDGQVYVVWDDTFDNVQQQYRYAMAKKVLFSTMNLTDVTILELEYTNQDLRDGQLRFFPIATTLPVFEKEEVVGVSNFDVVYTTAMRVSNGTVKGPIDYFLDDSKLYIDNALQIGLNLASYGAPVFNKKYQMVSLFASYDTNYNLGPQLTDIYSCFNRTTGGFNYTHPECLYKWKDSMLTRYNITMPGFSRKITNARIYLPRSVYPTVSDLMTVITGSLNSFGAKIPTDPTDITPTKLVEIIMEAAIQQSDNANITIGVNTNQNFVGGGTTSNAHLFTVSIAIVMATLLSVLM